MCQPSMPEMPDPIKERPAPPPTPIPVRPDDMGKLPPPISTSAGAGSDTKLKKKTTAKKDLARTRGINRFRIPLNVGSNKTSLNIPK